MTILSYTLCSWIWKSRAPLQDVEQTRRELHDKVQANHKTRDFCVLETFGGISWNGWQNHSTWNVKVYSVYCWQYLIYIWNHMPSLWQKWCYFLHTWQSSFIDLIATRQQETWWPLVPGDWRIPTATPPKFDIDIQVFKWSCPFQSTIF